MAYIKPGLMGPERKRRKQRVGGTRALARELMRMTRAGRGGGGFISDFGPQMGMGAGPDGGPIPDTQQILNYPPNRMPGGMGPFSPTMPPDAGPGTISPQVTMPPGAGPGAISSHPTIPPELLQQLLRQQMNAIFQAQPGRTQMY